MNFTDLPAFNSKIIYYNGLVVDYKQKNTRTERPWIIIDCFFILVGILKITKHLIIIGYN